MFFTQISQIARISPHRCARGGVCHTDSTDFSASRCLQGLARTYSPCPAGRDLVNLVDYFPSGIFSGCGYFNLVDFLQGIAGCARWMGFSLARGVTQISQIPQIISHRCARGGGYGTQKSRNSQKLSHCSARGFFYVTQITRISQIISHRFARDGRWGKLINN